MEFRILGPLEVVADGGPIAVTAAKPRALLALLLLHANEPLGSDRLIEELWGGRPPATAAKTLQTYISKLRRLLGEERILTTPAGYQIRLEADELDLDRFQRLRADARLHDALALWRGPPLADFVYEGWAQTEIARLGELHLTALEEAIEADLALGRHAELVGDLEKLIAEHPLRERLREQMMLALYRSGRQAEALKVYRETRTMLVEELGIEPGPALQELNRAILAQERALEAAPFEEAASVPRRSVHVPRGQATSFVGRKKQLREIRSLLCRADVRLVTLTGAGGTGKTRLAFEATAEVGRDFRHGTVVVDLMPISDPELVATTIAGALGLRESPGRGAAEAVAAFVRGREMLLVLDNFEQVLGAAPLLAELVERAPGPTILVTSRAPLRLPVEQIYPVPPLQLPETARPLPVQKLRRVEAVRLFVERARRARWDFELSDENVGAVAELCVHLDGLPLALELAAGRVRLLSPRAIVARLGRRLDLLKTETADVPRRHRTLRAAIEWSYDLLSEEQQRLFTSLATFVGGFTLDGAEAVAETTGLDVLDGVESLLDISLLRPGGTAAGEPRFEMLETIREYAVERLAERPDGDEVRRRHAAFYVALAEEAEPQLRGPRQVSWLERLDADNDNLRAALAWTVASGEAELGLRGGAALWRFWQIRGLLGEGREWLEPLLALDTAVGPSPIQAGARAAAGRLSYMQGDYDSARGYLEESLPALPQFGDGAWTAHAVAILGAIAHAQGDEQSALRLAEESLEIARASRDWWVRSQALGLLGDLFLAQRKRGEARLAFEESLRGAREVGDLRQIARILAGLGLIALAEREHEQARLIFEEGLAVQRELGDSWNIARSLDYLGLVARGIGDRVRAKQLFAEALTMQTATDDRPGIATSLELLAELAASEGRARRAARLYSAAEVLRYEVGVHPMGSIDRDESGVDALRAVLGEQAFAEAKAKGRSMMLDEVIAYALEDERPEADLELVRPASADA